MVNLVIFISVFLLAWLLVGVFRIWSKTRRIVDVPNERSSHEQPTPVGAGIVIVVLTLSSMAAWEFANGNGLRLWPVYVSSLAIAGVSWFDDIKHIPAPVRLTVHLLAASLIVWQIGAFDQVAISPGLAITTGKLGIVFTILWIVWLTNAYNFMDGIDGLAGLQSVTASAGWALLAAFFGLQSILVIALLIMASSLGFLVHNWPPARVFMGDVGSAFLGFMFAVIPILAVYSEGSELISSRIPIIGLAFVWLFVADTVLTLVKRLVEGEKIWSAHRKHMYQRLVREGLSHMRVTGLYGILMALISAAALTNALTSSYLSLYATAAVATAVPALVLSKMGRDSN